jgi:hypothetical protein
MSRDAVRGRRRVALDPDTQSCRTQGAPLGVAVLGNCPKDLVEEERLNPRAKRKDERIEHRVLERLG